MNKIIIGLVVTAIVIAGWFFFTQKQYQPSQQSQQQSTSQSKMTAGADTVTIKNFSFTPDVLTVKQGAMVTWINQDSAPHALQSDTFQSSTLNQGDIFEFAFNDKGNFDYHCSIHPSMTGKIVVE